jgi:hypothetical protein
MRTKEEILARLKDAKEKQVKESDNQCLDSWISALSWVLAKEENHLHKDGLKRKRYMKYH